MEQVATPKSSCTASPLLDVANSSVGSDGSPVSRFVRPWETSTPKDEKRVASHEPQGAPHASGSCSNNFASPVTSLSPVAQLTLHSLLIRLQTELVELQSAPAHCHWAAALQQSFNQSRQALERRKQEVSVTYSAETAALMHHRELLQLVQSHIATVQMYKRMLQPITPSNDSGYHSMLSTPSPYAPHHYASPPQQDMRFYPAMTSPTLRPSPYSTTNCSGGKRTLSRSAVKVMEEWYYAHFDNPYPSEEEVDVLAANSGLSPTQVKKWMANKRVRSHNTLSYNGNIHPLRARRLKRIAACTTPNAASPVTSLTAGARHNVPLRNHAVTALTTWYEEHKQHPYPTQEERDELARIGGVTSAQVRCWFANRRARDSNTRRQGNS